MPQTFFYDAQIERFLIQFIRLVSNFQVEFGPNREGVKALQRVPVYYADGSRQVASIITNNSPNALPTTPAMTVYIDSLNYDRDRVQEPTFVGKMSIRQKYYNEETQEYENRQGNAFTIERSMPVPYTIGLKVDIWCSNTKQKLQLLEQLITMFNPALELQSTDNYIDWTSLSVVFLETPTWTSRSVPIGTTDPIDVATLTFKLPVWISPPVKVKQLGVIRQIINNIHNEQGDITSDVYNETNLLGRRQYFTPLGYGVLLLGNSLTLLRPEELAVPRANSLEDQEKIGAPVTWAGLISVYGELENGISQVRLLQQDGFTEVIGTVSYHPTDELTLIFNADIDTYPSNTLQAINAIIDPRKVTVDNNVLDPAVGTRYLILNDIGSWDNPPGGGPIAWRGEAGIDLVAYANDIIQYNGTYWTVSFDSQQADTVQYVSNLTTGTQYKWNLEQWVKSWEGEYKEGEWTLVI